MTTSMGDRDFTEEVSSRFNATILCTRNRPKEASSVLHQIQACEDRPELILVVDGSDEAQSLELQEDISDLPDVIFMRSAPGLTKQRNVGLGALPSNTGIVHFLDDDVEIEPDYFQVNKSFIYRNCRKEFAKLQLHFILNKFL